MKGRKLTLLTTSVLLLLIVSLAIYSQIKVEDNDYITHAEFVNILIRVLKLEDQLPVAATLEDKILLLEKLGYAPLDGWELERILNKGDTATVLALIIGIDLLDKATPEDYIRALTDQGIMTFDRPDLPFSLRDLTGSINTAAAMPGLRAAIDIPPYRLPVSPVQ